MELEVGLKISKTRDDITSTSEFRIAKDRAGPVFLSRETNSMFVLTAHLTGYKRDNIDIKINEDGTEISISGEKPVQEKLMLGWIMLKKEVEIKGFRKVFKIPHGVILDRIKAKYSQEESVFKIVMPKLVKGISGVRIEEVKEEGGGTGRGSLQSEAGHASNSIGETSKQVSKDSKIQKTKETPSVGEKMLVEGGNGVIKGDLTEGKHETSEEGIKVTQLDQNVAHHIPSNIDETNKEAISDKTGESERTLVEANAVIAENKEPQIESVDKSKEDGREVGKGGFAYAATKTSMEESPQLVPETEDVKKAVIKRKGKGIECLEKKVGGEESKKMDAKPIMVIEKNITEETTQKGSEDPKIEHRHDDEQKVPENIGGKGEFEAMPGVIQDFPKQIEKMSLDGSKGFKETKMGEAEEVTEAKRTKESECFIDKVEGDLESKSMQKEANEVIDKNTLKEASEDEIEDSKVETNGNQQNLQENIVKGTFELLETVIEEFPKHVEEAIPKKVIKENEDTVSKVKEEGSTTMPVEGNGEFEKDIVEETSQNMSPKQAAEILLDGGKGSKETKGGETKEVKEEITKTKSPEETIHAKASEDFRENVTKETIQKEIQEAKVETKDRDQQCVKKDIISKGTLEAWGTAPEEFSKQIAESKVARLEETKKVKGEVRKSRETEVVADGESTMEEETLQEAPEKGTPESEGSKVKEVRKRGETEIVPVKDTPKREVPHTEIAPYPKVSEQQSVNQDILKLKRAKEIEQCTRCMDGTKTVASTVDQVAKPFQVPSLPSTQKSQVEEIEVPKIDNDTIAQQSARQELDHKGEIGRKDITGKELPKQDFTANVKDEKPRRKEEIRELDSERVDKSKVVEETMQTRPQKEVEEDLEPPEVTSKDFKEIDQKNDIQEPPGKELSPPRVEVQSKESFEPEKSGMKLNFPTTTRHLPEVEERKGYGHGKEGIKTPEIVEYQAAKGSGMKNIASIQQSIVEEKRKSDRDIEAKPEASIEPPKQKSEIFFQESNKGTSHSDDEEMDTLKRLEEKQKVDVREEAHLADNFPEKIQGRIKGPKMFAEDNGQQLVRESIDKKRFQTNVAEEELLKRGHGADTLLEKSEVPKMGETELASQQSLKRERAKTTKTAQDKKAGVKKISEMMPGKSEKEYLRESVRATLEIGEKPSKASATRPKATTEEFEDVKPINQTEKSQIEELSSPTMEVQRRAPHESARKQKILEIKGVPQEMERRKPMHVLGGNQVLEAEIPKRDVEPPEATVIHSKATNIEFMKVEPKGESDKEGTKELTSAFVQKLREEPYELVKPTMKQDTAKAEILQQVHKGKELIQCPQGARAGKVDEPSRFSSPPSTQQFEVEGEGKTEEYCEDRLQESEMKAYQDVEQAETSKPEIPTDQQFIKDDQQAIGEEERHEIEEVTANEQGDEASQDDLQESVEQKQLPRVEKKDDKRRSNKFCATLIVAGSAILISLTVFFIRHKRATKSNNNMQIVLRRDRSLMRT